MTPPLRASLALLALVAMPSCTVQDPNADKDDSSEECTAPSVTAGPDISITLGSTAAPTATGTACDGDVSYSWAVESVPVESAVDTGDLDVTDPATAKFAPDVVGTYVVSVVATDAAGATSAPDFVVITVASGNAAPIADCGANVTAAEDERVDLDGSASSDPEGAALQYSWSLSSAPACSTLAPSDLFNASTVSPAIVPDCPGVFVVGLAVSDGSNWSTADYCSITVAADNQPPIADAGDSGDLSPCTESSFELDGYGSYDPEGTALTYAWSVLASPTGASGYFDDAGLPNPTFSWDVPGTYTFQLQVFDGGLWSVPDIVTYTFSDESENSTPVANAGEDQTIAVTAECTTASYVFTCGDCPSEEVLLDGSASDDPVDGDELDFLWTESSGEPSIVSPHSPVTELLTPVMPATYNVATRRDWELVLTASDCADSDSDSVQITYTCTGEYSPG